MTKPSPWGGEPERLERPTKPEWVTENELADAMFEAGEQTAKEREKKFRAARRTPSQSPDGYEVQWRPRGSDTWAGGSAGVYRTPEIAAEVEKDFADHETRVRPIAYLDGAPSHSREPSASDVDPQEVLDRLDALAESNDHALGHEHRLDIRLASELIRDQIEMLAEFDATPVTDARIWDGVRDAIERHLTTLESVPAHALADELTTIALGERVEADHG